MRAVILLIHQSNGGIPNMLRSSTAPGRTTLLRGTAGRRSWNFSPIASDCLRGRPGWMVTGLVSNFGLTNGRPRGGGGGASRRRRGSRARADLLRRISSRLIPGAKLNGGVGSVGAGGGGPAGSMVSAGGTASTTRASPRRTAERDRRTCSSDSAAIEEYRSATRPARQPVTG